MNAKQRLTQEFKELHESYVADLCTFLDPEERKELLEESLAKAKDILDKAETLSEQELAMHLVALKEAKENVKYTRGTCSQLCFEALLHLQTRIILTAARKGVPAEVGIGVSLFITDTLTQVVGSMLKETASTKPTWEVRKNVHKVIEEATQLLAAIQVSIESGNFVAIKLPAPNNEKYKGLWN